MGERQTTFLCRAANRVASRLTVCSGLDGLQHRIVYSLHLDYADYADSSRNEGQLGRGFAPSAWTRRRCLCAAICCLSLPRAIRRHIPPAVKNDTDLPVSGRLASFRSVQSIKPTYPELRRHLWKRERPQRVSAMQNRSINTGCCSQTGARPGAPGRACGGRRLICLAVLLLASMLMPVARVLATTFITDSKSVPTIARRPFPRPRTGSTPTTCACGRSATI